MSGAATVRGLVGCRRRLSAAAKCAVLLHVQRKDDSGSPRVVGSSRCSPRALAQATGVSTDTLRHYERFGLLPDIPRTRAGYGRYAPSMVERVRLIQRALLIGFSLKELAAALHQREEGSPPGRRVRALVGDRLAALETRLGELTALRDEMHVLVRDGDDRLARTPGG